MKDVKAAKRIVSIVGWILAIGFWIIWYSVAPDEPEIIGWIGAIAIILIGEGLVKRVLIPEAKGEVLRSSDLPVNLDKQKIDTAFTVSIQNPKRLIRDETIINNFIEALNKKRSLSIDNEEIVFLYTGEEKPNPNKPPKYTGLFFF